jgi:hypothetical protein
MGFRYVKGVYNAKVEKPAPTVQSLETPVVVEPKKEEIATTDTPMVEVNQIPNALKILDTEKKDDVKEEEKDKPTDVVVVEKKDKPVAKKPAPKKKKS